MILIDTRTKRVALAADKTKQIKKLTIQSIAIDTTEKLPTITEAEFVRKSIYLFVEKLVKLEEDDIYKDLDYSHKKVFNTYAISNEQI